MCCREHALLPARGRLSNQNGTWTVHLLCQDPELVCGAQVFIARDECSLRPLPLLSFALNASPPLICAYLSWNLDYLIQLPACALFYFTPSLSSPTPPDMADDRFDQSEEEEEPFNPGNEIGSDDEVDAAESSARKQLDNDLAGDDDEDDDGDDGGDGGRARGDEDEEDEDDEEDEEEDAITNRPRKRRRKDGMNQFIDMEAEVDDEDEEDEDEEGPEAGFIQEENDIADDEPVGAAIDDRVHREMDRRREERLNADAEELAARYQEQYAGYGRREKPVHDTTVVPREFLAPSVDDPSIYGVKCKPGKEREVVFSILKRVEERARSKSPLKIFSALERGGPMAGYVYVEGRHQNDIMEATDGIMNCYPHSGFTMLAIKEMPDILRVRKTEQLQIGQYVRIKRAGLYQGDLAQVDDLESSGLDIYVKIVPRLHYGLTETGSADAKRKRPGAAGPRAPPRAFSEIEAKKKFPESLETIPGVMRGFKYFGDEYIDGFLYKSMKLQQLQVKDVHPKLEEVARFSVGQKDGTENLDLSALAASIKNNTSGDDYLAGDIVEIYEGEQSGIWGKTVSVRRDIVTLIVSEGALKGQRIEATAKSLRKRFLEGDHVKVMGNSRFQGEVGMVVGIKADKITFVSDMSMQEITVFSKDLRVATDTGATGSIGGYDLHDLVQLDQATVGCIVKVERESMRVLDQYDTTRNIMPSQVANKIEKRRNAVATDRAGNEIRLEDTVKEVEGERRSGTIMHIYRAFVFLRNLEMKENSGIFVARAANVATVAAKGGRTNGQGAAGPDLSRMNPALKAPGANGMPPPPRQSFGRDPLLGKTVKISKGPYKGLLGIVKDSTDSIARVELHSKNKTLPIDKTFLRIQDQNGGAVSYHDFVARGRGRGGGGGGPPGGFGGGRTPAGAGGGWGGPSRTPMGAHGSGGQTPGWGGAQSARTPAWSGAGGSTGAPSGAATPGWGGGSSRTPAWQAGSRTSYGGGDGSRTAYGGGGGGVSLLLALL